MPGAINLGDTWIAPFVVPLFDVFLPNFHWLVFLMFVLGVPIFALAVVRGPLLSVSLIALVTSGSMTAHMVGSF